MGTSNATAGVLTGLPTMPTGTQASFTQDPAGAFLGMLGFGPGPSWTPAQQAEVDAKIRESRRQSAVNRIKGIFDNREAAYDRVQNATTEHFLQQLNEQRDQAQRRIRFGLASRGLTGGSRANFVQGQAAKDYLQGKVGAQNRGMNAAQQMRIADEQAQQRLIGLAQSGLSTGSSAAMAQQALAQSLANARQRSQIGSIGNVFSDLLDQHNRYKDFQEQEALRNRYYQTLYALGYKPGGY